MNSTTSPEPTGPLLVRVRAVMPALAPAEQRVANAVLADPGGVAAMTISELAEVASTSETTVIRFCKQIGVPGYPQLRLQLGGQGVAVGEAVAGGDRVPQQGDHGGGGRRMGAGRQPEQRKPCGKAATCQRFNGDIGHGAPYVGPPAPPPTTSVIAP